MTFKLEYKYSRLDTQKGLFVMDETSDNNELKESLELYSQVFTIVSNTGTKKKLSGSLKQVLELAAGINSPLEPDDPYLLRLVDVCKHGIVLEHTPQDNSTGRKHACSSWESKHFFGQDNANILYSFMNKMIHHIART